MKKARTNQAEHKPSADCFSCQWRDRSQWCVLTHDELHQLSDAKTDHSYQSGQVLFNQGDAFTGLYCVIQGTVALRRTDSRGNTLLVRLCHPGDTIGYRDYFTGSDFSVSAEVVSQATLCFVHRSAFRELLHANPALSSELTRRLAFDADSSEEALLHGATLPVRSRMAHLLLALKDRYATVGSNGNLRLTLPLSRQDIADLLGTRPETVARVIHALEEDGVTRFSGRTVVIPDLDLLLDEVEPGE